MKIFLDDVRPLPRWAEPAEWTIIRTGEKCVQTIREVGLENISEISLDNDLGYGMSGRQVLDIIERMVMSEGKPLPKLDVHSFNPVEKQAMWEIITRLVKFVENKS